MKNWIFISAIRRSINFGVTFSRLICLTAYTDPVWLWYARHTFPNRPFPRTFPSLNSSLKELLCLILFKMRGFLGCYWLEIFLFAGVRTFVTFEDWFIIYFGEVILIFSGFIASIFFWLWVFFRVFWSVLAVWYPVF